MSVHSPAPDSIAAIMTKVLHLMGGIYICEFFTSLWFEWQVIKKTRTYRWSIWLYSGCRILALFAVVATFVGFGVTTPIDCRAWIVLTLLFMYSSLVFASALIVLRIVAIWEKNSVVCTIAFAAWLVNITFYIRNIIWSEAIWSVEQATCLITRTNRTTTVAVTLGEDLVLLILMFLGLRRHGDSGMHGLWRFLHCQGLSWLVIVAVAEVPKTVFVILDSNGYFGLMFQASELVVIAIGASRIYRSLADYRITTTLDWQNDRFLSFWVLYGATSSNLPTGTIQFNNISESHSYSESQADLSPAHPAHPRTVDRSSPTDPVLVPPYPELALSHT
ncbi:hypothetical protein EDB84DRAFT_1494874 [Lactarius hengduanensis]|nr:hypothetical protein EDB84DRAFT_1494874 [Lactarius hengduanensis]